MSLKNQFFLESYKFGLLFAEKEESIAQPGELLLDILLTGLYSAVSAPSKVKYSAGANVWSTCTAETKSNINFPFVNEHTHLEYFP